MLCTINLEPDDFRSLNGLFSVLVGLKYSLYRQYKCVKDASRLSKYNLKITFRERSRNSVSYSRIRAEIVHGLMRFQACLSFSFPTDSTGVFLSPPSSASR